MVLIKANHRLLKLPGIAELVEDCVLEDCGEVVRVSTAQVLEAGEEEGDGLLGLEPLLDQVNHHVHIQLRGRGAVQADALKQLLSGPEEDRVMYNCTYRVTIN